MPDPIEPIKVRHPMGGYALLLERMIWPGAVLGQVLKVASDGAGGLHFVPGTDLSGSGGISAPLQGVFASRPAADATTAGQTYYATDQALAYVCLQIDNVPTYAWFLSAMGASAADARVAIGAVGDLYATEGDVMIRGAFSTTIITTTTVGRQLMIVPDYYYLRGTVIQGGTFGDARAGAGWSAIAPTGGGVAAWAVGPPRLNLLLAGGVTSSCGVEATAYLLEADRYTFKFNVRYTTGDAAAGANGTLAVKVGQDDENCIQFTLNSAGGMEVAKIVATAYTAVFGPAATGITSGERTGGNLWLAFERTMLGFIISWGIGSGGSVPTAWKPLFVPILDLEAIWMSNGRYVSIAAVDFTGIVGGYEIDVLAISNSAHSGGIP